MYLLCLPFYFEEEATHFLKILERYFTIVNRVAIVILILYSYGGLNLLLE